MKLTQIDILKYKSIKQPVSIVFNEGQVVTLIGKNGSGKTNILEAIKYAMTKNYYGNEKIECKIQYHIELTDDEITDYFSCVQVDEKSKRIVVDFDSNYPEKRFLSSSAISIEAKSFKERLEKVLSDFKEASKKYINALKQIESSDSFYGEYFEIDAIEENHGSLTHLVRNYINNYESNIKQQVNDIKNYLSEIFDGERISLNRYERNQICYRIWDIPLFKISEDEEIKISPIVAFSLKISKQDLDNANKKLNKKLRKMNMTLEHEYSEMEACLDEYDKIKKEISAIFDKKSDQLYEAQELIDKNFESVMQRIYDIIFCNCYFLDNENSLIFNSSKNRDYQNEVIKEQYLNSRNPIVAAFDAFIHQKGILDDEISFSQTDKLSDKQLKKCVKVLNTEFLPRIIPKFDSDEIIGFSVDEKFNLFVHEKNGDVVSFYNTSLGRRWYLTYQFVKALLKPGDMLLIDEPAAFLHPQAQTEFKEELIKLSHDGIYVFYSTHSPYMIPEEWGHVFNVTMTASGTQALKCDSGDDLCEAIRQELGVSKTVDILFNLEKNIILVEGVADKVCFEKFAQLLKRDSSNYYIHVCDGESILQVAYMCLKYKIIKVKVVLDNDNKYKNERYKRGHSLYNDCIKMINQNMQNCIFLGEGEQGCLEDMFVENPNSKFKKYINQSCKWKMDLNMIREIQSIDEVSEETKNNFEQLFTKLGIPILDDGD